MSIRDSKEKIINEIMNLRTMIDDIKIIEKQVCTFNDIKTIEVLNVEKKEETQRQLNKIQDMIFNL